MIIKLKFVCAIEIVGFKNKKEKSNLKYLINVINKCRTEIPYTVSSTLIMGLHVCILF